MCRQIRFVYFGITLGIDIVGQRPCSFAVLFCVPCYYSCKITTFSSFIVYSGLHGSQFKHVQGNLHITICHLLSAGVCLTLKKTWKKH